MPAFSLHHQSLEGLFHRGAGRLGGVQSVDKFSTLIISNFVRNLIFIKNAHSIRLYFFSHKIFTPLFLSGKYVL